MSALCRYMQQQAEDAGAYLLTETAATQLIVEDGEVKGVRSGDKGRGKDGEPLGNFEPGTDIAAKATVLAEGCWGHLTGAAIREFDLGEDREPMVWELGVKEVWKVPKPLDRVIHTLAGWPLKISAKYHQIGGSWIYPMKDEKTGDDLVSIGFVIDLDYADATTSAPRPAAAVQDPPDGAQDPRGRRARLLGRQGDPGRRLLGDAQAHDAGRGDRRRRRRHGQPGRAQGRALRDQVGHARRRADLRLAEGRAATTSPPYEQAIEDSIIGKDLYEQRNTRQPFQMGLIKGGPLVNLMIATKGRFPGGRWKLHRNDAQKMFIGKTKKGYPKPDGKYIFDKLSSVFITGNATRDDAPNHIRVQTNVPREIAETWQWMCPAGVYEIPEDAPETGDVDVIVNYTNCVQCGAITAKGGRLTTPEGGDGPLYRNT